MLARLNAGVYLLQRWCDRHRGRRREFTDMLQLGLATFQEEGPAMHTWRRLAQCLMT